MSAPVEVKGVLSDLRSVVRIAKAASSGVPGNATRIERAERALSAVAELIEVSKSAERLLRDMAEAGFGDPGQADDLRAALARAEGGSHG